MNTLPLSELLGATVYDPSGAPSCRGREVTLAPQEDRTRIASLQRCHSVCETHPPFFS
jgi:hypothetical protein